MRVHCQYYFDNECNVAVEAVIKQVVVSLKSRKAITAITNANQLTEILPKMIDNGDNTNSVISPGSDYMQLSYPYEKEIATKLTGDRTYSIRKNYGGPNYAVNSVALTYGPSMLRVSFDVKCPELTFDNVHNSPTNFCPLWGVAAGLVSDTTYNASLGAISSGTPTNPILRASCRTELWFKDA